MKLTVELQGEYLRSEDKIIAIFPADEFSEEFRKILFSEKNYSWTYVDAILPNGIVAESCFIVIQKE